MLISSGVLWRVGLCTVNSETASNPLPTGERVQCPWAPPCHLLMPPELWESLAILYKNDLFKHVGWGATLSQGALSVYAQLWVQGW